MRKQTADVLAAIERGVRLLLFEIIMLYLITFDVQILVVYQHAPFSFYCSRGQVQDIYFRMRTHGRMVLQAPLKRVPLVFSRPWLDGPTALAAVLHASGSMKLATTVSIPVVRGPVAMVKTLGAIDLLSGGRLVVGVGPGSSAQDYALIGIPFEERWKRLDEAVQTLRSLWSADADPFEGVFYSTKDIRLEPYPTTPSGPPIWIGSWGSRAGLRRTARLGDGWLASAYNTTPEIFGEAKERLNKYLQDVNKNPNDFPNALATTFMYITEDKAEAERVMDEIIAPTVNRPQEELVERLPVGSASDCAEKLSRYSSAGLQEMFLWPVRDEVNQIEAFMSRVAPLVESNG